MPVGDFAQADSGVVQLWDKNSQKISPIDTGEKALTFIGWSKVGPQLAIGSAKGALSYWRRHCQWH